MNTKKTQDKIDIELSRTYFGTAVKKTGSGPVQKDTGVKKKGKTGKNPSRRRFPPKIIITSLAIIACFVFAAIYFFSHNRLVLTVNVDIKPLSGGKKYAKELQKPDPLTTPGVAAKKSVIKNEKILYDFEKDENGWEIPLWAADKPDYVATSLKKTDTAASNGTGSIEIYADFTGGNWSAALAEIQQYLDLNDYERISADIYLPPDAPKGLRAKLILTIGDNWQFVEMARGIRLDAGQWTTVTADLSPGSTDWRRTRIDNEFRQDIRKIAIRIESNKTAYSGPFYVDDIRVTEK